MAARIGGEEFGLGLPGADLDAAYACGADPNDLRFSEQAARRRRRVRDRRLPERRHHGRRVLRAADRALYDASSVARTARHDRLSARTIGRGAAGLRDRERREHEAGRRRSGGCRARGCTVVTGGSTRSWPPRPGRQVGRRHGRSRSCPARRTARRTRGRITSSSPDRSRAEPRGRRHRARRDRSRWEHGDARRGRLRSAPRPARGLARRPGGRGRASAGSASEAVESLLETLANAA